MEESPAAPAHRLSTTVVMSIAALCAALIAVFGDKQALGWLTVGFALAGLVPWALEAGGVRLPPGVFLAMTMIPAAVIVLGDRNPGGMFPVMLAIVWVTMSGVGTPFVVATVTTGAALAIGLALLEGTTHETGTVYFLGGVGVSWMGGAMAHRQERLVAELHAAHRQQAELAAAAERTRIAREVHDVVAHSLTVTMLHVTGARRAMSTDPVRAAEALERAEQVGRESLDSIRRMVGLLRAPETEPGQAPSPGDPLPELTDIGSLVEQYREAGLRVSADIGIDGVTADPTTSLTAFRVVQEALANVLQHSPGAPVELRLALEGDGTTLRIVAENPTTTVAPRTDRVGLGLRGMTERVRAVGGSIEAGATDRRTWRIDAALPLRPATVP